MKKIGLIIHKELTSIFSSPVAYILLGLFSILTGILFSNTLQTYLSQIQILTMEEQQRISFTQEVLHRFFANIHFILLFFTPIFTMRLIAEERKQGTMDLLWLSPMSEMQIIAGKYIGVFLFFMTFISITFVYPFLLLDAGLKDINSLFLGYLALLLSGACYLSIGLLCSALTNNPMVAAISTFVILMINWLLNWVGQLTGQMIIREILAFIAITTHFENLVQGNLSISSLIYFICFILFMNLLTVKVQESRHW